MRTVKEITSNYDDYNFGIEIKGKQNTTSLEIKSFWGKYDIYCKIVKELKMEGYTVFE